MTTDINEVCIAKMLGGVFFDRLLIDDWKSQYEPIRRCVREAFKECGLSSPIEAKAGTNGLEIKYDFEDTNHTIQLVEDAVNFSFNRFRIAAGVPPVLGLAVDRILKEVRREDWVRIGTLVGFAVPARSGSGDSSFAVNYLRAQVQGGSEPLLQPFTEGTLSNVDLTLRGTVDKALLSINIYNTDEQSLVLTSDTRVSREDIPDASVSDFFKSVFAAFLDRFGQYIVNLLGHPDIAKHVDMDFLKTGKR